MSAFLGVLALRAATPLEFATQTQPNILMIVADGALRRQLTCHILSRDCASAQRRCQHTPALPHIESPDCAGALSAAASIRLLFPLVWFRSGRACVLTLVTERRNQISATTTWDTTNQRPLLPNHIPPTRKARPRLTPRQVSCQHPTLPSSHLRGQSWRCTTCSHCALLRAQHS